MTATVIWHNHQGTTTKYLALNNHKMNRLTLGLEEAFWEENGGGEKESRQGRGQQEAVCAYLGPVPLRLRVCPGSSVHPRFSVQPPGSRP